MTSQSPVTADLIGKAIPEFLFPAGCAAVRYVTERAGRLARAHT